MRDKFGTLFAGLNGKKFILSNYPILFLIIYIIVGVYVQYNGIIKFNSLPSPIYGGDYYYQMGSIIHVIEGGNPLESSSIQNTIPGYLPLYSYLCAHFCNIFNFNALSCMFYFSLFLFIISSFLYFFTFKIIFNNNSTAVLGSIIANNLTTYPILKYTPFTHQIMLPLFILFLYLSYKEKKLSFYLLLGLTYGFLAISHTVCFVGATIILLIFFLSEIISFKKTKIIFKIYKSTLKNYFILFLAALPISMLYWYKPLFLYHLNTKTDIVHWAGAGALYKLDVQIDFLLNSIKQYLFNFNTLFFSIVTILTWIGIYIFYKKESETKKFILLFLLGSVTATYSYFITEPLFNINFVPNYMSYFYLSSSLILLLLFGIKNLDLKNFYKQLIFLILFITLSAYSVLAFNNYIDNDKWANVGKNKLPERYLSVQNYLLNYTNVNDVILSTKELSFVLNSLSGRKLVTNRWSQQNNPYIDFAQRDLDAAILLYSNNTKKIKELIKKYNISYFYWDYYWVNSEFTFNNKGEIVNIFDPLIVFNEKKYKDELDKHNIKYFQLNWWVDPAIKGKNFPKYDILIISPENYRNSTHPWSYAFDKYIEEVWNFTKNGNKMAALYRIKIT